MAYKRQDGRQTSSKSYTISYYSRTYLHNESQTRVQNLFILYSVRKQTFISLNYTSIFICSWHKRNLRSLTPSICALTNAQLVPVWNHPLKHIITLIKATIKLSITTIVASRTISQYCIYAHIKAIIIIINNLSYVYVILSR